MEEDVCYTAIVTGDSLSGTEWTEGLFVVNTAFEEIVYEEWTQEGNTWVVQFSLNNDCEGDVPNPDDIYGCTDPEADNYDALAWIDDGSCMYDNLCDGLFEVLFVLDGGLMPEEVGLNVSNEDGELLMEMDGYTGSSAGCLPAGCYTVEMLDSFGDGWNGPSQNSTSTANRWTTCPWKTENTKCASLGSVQIATAWTTTTPPVSWNSLPILWR